MKIALIGCLLLLPAAGCSKSHAARADQASPSRDGDIITAEELGNTTVSTVYDAVRQLRPAWLLRSRPTAVVRQNQAQLVVYVDGVRYGGFESLRQVTKASVAFVRYYSPGSAEARFGPGHLLGAIEVKSLPH
jgi:hypothetical protein